MKRYVVNEELDKAVAKAQGWEHIANSDWEFMRNGALWVASQYHPSTNWEQAGELLEKYAITLTPYGDVHGNVCEWRAITSESKGYATADTPQRAICLAVLELKGEK